MPGTPTINAKPSVASPVSQRSSNRFRNAANSALRPAKNGGLPRSLRSLVAEEKSFTRPVYMEANAALCVEITSRGRLMIPRSGNKGRQTKDVRQIQR